MQSPYDLRPHHGAVKATMTSLSLPISLLNVGYESRQRLQISATVVVLGLVTLPIEPLQCWEPLDAKSGAQRPVLIRVNFGDRHLVL